MARNQNKPKSNEFENFDATMRKLLTVPHREIKAKLDAERKRKGQKPKRPKR